MTDAEILTRLAEQSTAQMRCDDPLAAVRRFNDDHPGRPYLADDEPQLLDLLQLRRRVQLEIDGLMVRLRRGDTR